ncbi:MAG: hypothetical protein JRK53_17760 [Deltaproteobacteria bacterium]|nr:hypothetical protein [Deltaproteobacteria bacterium]MBW1818945.1 hypothetical protein [Deltaproteobacteria bacterium]
MTLEDDAWVWVAVQDPEGDARFVGRHDAERDASFIPAFQSREAAEAGLERLDRDAGIAVEVQAIQLGDLGRQAGENGFSVAVIDDDGEIVEKKGP